MPRRTDLRLSREVFIRAALDVSRQNGANGGGPLTGQALGTALGVDRSAVWRHFSGKDDLLLAVADALLVDAAERVRSLDDPFDVLEAVWNGVVDAFVEHPWVGAQLGDRSVSGPNALLTIERLIAAFERLGFSAGAALLAYRAFIDMTLSCAATGARYVLLTEAERRSDDAAMEMAIRTLDPVEHPLLTARVDTLMGLDPQLIRDEVFSTYVAGLRARTG